MRIWLIHLNIILGSDHKVGTGKDETTLNDLLKFDFAVLKDRVKVVKE
jgi:hypothetical protein